MLSPNTENICGGLGAHPVRWDAMIKYCPSSGLKIAGASACRKRQREIHKDHFWGGEGGGKTLIELPKSTSV